MYKHSLFGSSVLSCCGGHRVNEYQRGRPPMGVAFLTEPPSASRPVTPRLHLAGINSGPRPSTSPEPSPLQRPLITGTENSKAIGNKLTGKLTGSGAKKPMWGSMRKGGTLSGSLNAARKEMSEAAAAERQTALKASSSVQVREARGRADEAASRHRWRECSNELSTVLDANIAIDPTLYTYRSHVLLRQHRLAEALEDSERAVQLAPQSARAHYRQARALTHHKRWNEAGERLVATLALSPRDARSDGRLDEVLGSLRRARPFWPGPKKRPERQIGGSPPPTSKPPGPCELTLRETTDCLIRVSFSPPEDDGGDEIGKYLLEASRIDPLMPDAPPEWVLAFEGLPSGSAPWSRDVVELEADTEYQLRVCACNENGRGAVGALLRCSTKPEGPGTRELDTRIPKPWLELQANMQDLFGNLAKKHGVEQPVAWDALLETWRKHLGDIKLAYRL